jgi:hypothetical protein
MQRRMFVIALALLAVSATLSAAPGPYDQWVGTWVYSYDKSTHDEESAVKMTRVFEAVGDDGMKFTRDAISAHGEQQHSVYVIKFDGKDYHAVGQTSGGTQAYRRIDSNTLECISKSPNGNSLKQVMVLAKDGKSFVLTETGKYANDKISNHYSVFEKQ